MANTSLILRVMAASPHIEMLARRIYWHNVKLFSRLKKNKEINQSPKKAIDFQAILEFIMSHGAKRGGLLLVHSSFSALKPTSMNPDQIIDRLKGLVGEEGTLAMPAMPLFHNRKPKESYLADPSGNEVYVYDVNKSKIKTGVLPSLLCKRNGAIRSRHPINTMVAWGPLASILMRDNLAGSDPLPCGIGSSWYHCAQEDALIVGLGVDLTHSLTMIHVAEDVLDHAWPIKNWYQYKKFMIIDGKFSVTINLRERRPIWGALHFAERTLCKDLVASGILKSSIIDGVIVEVIRAKELLDFLADRNCKGYPYFWV